MITVITVNYNNGVGLASTIESFLMQVNTNASLLVIDGGSNDSSLDVLRNFATEERIQWVSEADSGIYNAMNKGVRLSSTPYLTFINSGDTLAYEDSLCTAEGVINGNLDRALYIFDAINLRTGERQKKRFFRPFRRPGLCHQRVIYNTEVFPLIFDERFRFAADFHSLIKVMKAFSGDSKNFYSRTVLSIYEGGGASFQNKEAIIEERNKILLENKISLLSRRFCVWH